jgi:hypothetical protein
VACEGCDQLLRQARDELFSLRTAIAPLRNRAKVAVAAIDDAMERQDALIARLDAELSRSPGPKEAHGNGSTEGSQQDRLAAA